MGWLHFWSFLLAKALHKVRGPGEPSPGAIITSCQRKGMRSHVLPSHKVRLLEYVSILLFPLWIQIMFSMRLIIFYEVA